MTSPDDFLTRWSRRKRAVKAEESSPPPGDATGKSAQPPPDHPAGSDNPPAKQSEPAFDLSKLPSLDSIGPDTDVRMFMQPGVPAALSRAAFRRAWAADPAIRDFIGLSENSWDFTAPDSIVGFGPLAPTDNVKRMLADLFNDAPEPPADHSSEEETDDTVSASSETQSEETQSNDDQYQADLQTAEESITESNEENALHRSNLDDAPQQNNFKSEFSVRSRRKHGSALPG